MQGVSIMLDRLFLPLNTEWYNMFIDKTKTWEIRGISKCFNKSTVKTGRQVEIRKGYHKKSAIWGTIGQIVTTDNIFNLREDIFKAAIPTTDEDLMTQIERYNYKYDQFIVFEVILP
jgi:hypothetical protein